MVYSVGDSVKLVNTSLFAGCVGRVVSVVSDAVEVEYDAGYSTLNTGFFAPNNLELLADAVELDISKRVKRVRVIEIYRNSQLVLVVDACNLVRFYASALPSSYYVQCVREDGSISVALFGFNANPAANHHQFESLAVTPFPDLDTIGTCSACHAPRFKGEVCCRSCDYEFVRDAEPRFVRSLSDLQGFLVLHQNGELFSTSQIDGVRLREVIKSFECWLAACPFKPSDTDYKAFLDIAFSSITAEFALTKSQANNYFYAVKQRLGVL